MCPPVSSITVRPRDRSLSIKRVDLTLQQRLAAGDLHDRAVVGATPSPTTSSTDILRPSANAYGVSHHVHLRSQAVSRTNTHGRPTWVDSPWIEWKISLMVSMEPGAGIFYCTLSTHGRSTPERGGYNTAMAKPIFYWKPT